MAENEVGFVPCIYNNVIGTGCSRLAVFDLKGVYISSTDIVRLDIDENFRVEGAICRGDDEVFTMR